ncbi:hypothetical protein E0493_14705 [Roseomonas sp. M0104]|uniref:Uncharacterized protein n=1 Tax=Teichococcus coralli TaxID=2545983 RepID=A0A845BER7_9PROT|nr:hypothetical protein [Pseudoroseomonas coralli]MXP64600.1 hypothetical protein [Pseudoroseomonas coralli]
MATTSMRLPPAARRQAVMKALAQLAQGQLAEEVRLEAAARLLRTARGALEMVDMVLPVPAGMAGWDPRAITAREHVEGLPPAELDRLLAEGPRWAAALLRAEPELRRAA